MRSLTLILAIFFTTTSTAQYITSIDYEIGVDTYLVFPYTSIGATHSSGIRFETGMLDYPNSTNAFFQEAIRVKTQNYSWFPRVEDIGDYQKRTRGLVSYLLVGIPVYLGDDAQINLMGGYCSDEGIATKISLSYPFVSSENLSQGANVRLTLSTITTPVRVMVLFGYSAYVFW